MPVPLKKGHTGLKEPGFLVFQWFRPVSLQPRHFAVIQKVTLSRHEISLQGLWSKGFDPNSLNERTTRSRSIVLRRYFAARGRTYPPYRPYEPHETPQTAGRWNVARSKRCASQRSLFRAFRISEAVFFLPVSRQAAPDLLASPSGGRSESGDGNPVAESEDSLILRPTEVIARSTPDLIADLAPLDSALIQTPYSGISGGKLAGSWSFDAAPLAPGMSLQPAK